MKSKKLMAVALTATMVVGSSVTAFAGDPAPTGANGATGSGTAFNHVDKDVIAVTLPTTSDVADVFDYYVDPERAIQDAGTLNDGDTAVTPNSDGVYFAHAGAAAQPEVTAAVTAWSIGGTTEATENVTVSVPNTTATGTKLTYSKGWKDSDGNAVNVSVVKASDSSAITLTKDDTLSYDSSSMGWTPSFAADSTLVANSDVTVTVTPSDPSADVVYTYHDEWVANDADKTEVTPTIGGSAAPTPADGDTITFTPYQAAQPAGTATFAADSEEVTFEGKNSVDVDISVAATVTASAGGKDIALVKDQDALDDATTPALLMTLHVGTKSAAITSDGATVKETITGKPSNFAVTTSDDDKFVYGIRTNTDVANGGTALDAWGSAGVKLAGKTNNKTIAEGMTAPQIGLTWTITKHATSALSASTISATSNTLTVTSGVNVTGVTLVKTTGATAACTSGTNYTYSNGTLTVQAGLLSNNRGGKLRIALSNGNTEEVTIQ